MPLNISALAPGPAGTTMLGERGGIEAAARRGEERKKREREEAAAREGKIMDDSMSGTTPVIEDSQQSESGQYPNHMTDTGSMTKGSEHNTQSAGTSSTQAKETGEKDNQGLWGRLKGKFQ